jgi:helicase MOV-10
MVGGRIVKLVKNFRNHPAILQFSNAMFYNGELKPCGDPALTHSLQRSDALVSRNFPLVFHGIVGKDEREASSPSFFNIDEATLVKKYCQELISHKKPAVRELFNSLLG